MIKQKPLPSKRYETVQDQVDKWKREIVFKKTQEEKKKLNRMIQK